MKKNRITAFVSSLLLTANLMAQTLPLEVLAQEEATKETSLTFSEEPIKTVSYAPQEQPAPSEGAVSQACGESTKWTYDTETKTLYLQGEGEIQDFYLNSEIFIDYAPQVETLIIENGITSITANTLKECTNLKALVIPRLTLLPEGDVSNASLNDWFGGQDLRKQLTSVTILSAESIPENYFKDMNLLESVSLPENLKTIQAHAFANCSALTEIILPEGLETIAEQAFEGCSGVVNLSLPDSLKEIGYMAFKGMTELKELVIPPNVEKLGTNLIYADGKLESLTLPFALAPDDEKGENSSGATVAAYLGSNAMPLKKVTVTGGTIIPYNFLNGYATVTEVNLPDSIEIIGQNAFYNCSGLTSIHLPEHLEIIREGAFRGCTSMTELKLPENIKRIEYTAFFGMNEITELTIPDSAEYIGTDLFGNDSKMQSLTLPFAGETRDATDSFYAVSTIGFSSSNREIPLTEITLTGGTRIPDTYFQFMDNLKTVNLPDTITEIGNAVFYNGSGLYSYQNTALESIVIPDSVISIGSDTFRNCPNLKEITFSKNLREVGARVFEDTAWLASQTEKGFINAGNTIIGYNGDYPETLDIPAGTLGIGEHAFTKGTFSAVNFPDGLLYIGRNAFDSCGNLKEIVLPDTVEEIDDRAFISCSSLEKVEIPETVSTVGSDVFNGSSWDSIQEDGPIYIGTKFYGYKGTVPPHTKLKLRDGIDTIVDGALQNCANLDEIILPDSVKTIGKNAFNGCISLSSVILPDSVTDIGESAFAGCTELTEIQLSANLQKIGMYAFKNCKKLTKADIPYGTQNIENYAFYNCGALRDIVIPDTLTNIGYQGNLSNAFGFDKDFVKAEDFVRTLTIAEGSKKVTREMTQCFESVVSVTLPEGLTTICENAFTGFSNVSEIVLPSTLTEVEKRAFYQLENLQNIGNTCTLAKVGEEAFYHTGITETPAFTPDCELNKSSFANCESLVKATLPENIQTIPREVFCNCYALPEIVIPNSVTQIDYAAFWNNISLKTITFPNQLEDEFAMSGVFVSKDTINEAFYYDTALLDGNILERTIIFAEGRKNFSSTLMNSFRKDAVAVVLPESLETIENQAFENCEVLKSVTVPDNVSELGTECFKSCDALTEIKLPKELKAIPEGAFCYCTALTEIAIPETVTEIGASAFSGCTSLRAMTIPDSVTKTGNEVFNNCQNLRSLKLSENLTEISSKFCYDCGALQSISIPEKVKKIGNSAFYNCYALREIEISDTAGLETFGAFGLKKDNDFSYRTVTIREGSQTVPKALMNDLKQTVRQVNLPDSVTYLPDYVFDGCSVLRYITLPESIKTIGKGAFRGTDIAQLTIPDSVTELSEAMCENCRNLIKVKFSENISVIPDLAFANCTSLTTVDTQRESYTFRSSHYRGSFAGCVSLSDKRFTVLNRKDMNFSANVTEIKPNGFVNFTVHYSFHEGLADKDSSKIVIDLPEGATAIPESLEEGECNETNSKITLKNTGNSVTRTFSVRFSDIAEEYEIAPVLQATIQGEEIEETVGLIRVHVYGVSINVPNIIGSLNDVTVNGFVPNGKTVTIYADGVEVGTAEASQVTGRYVTKISLPEKEEPTYSLTCKFDDQESEPVTVTYYEGVPEIEKVMLGYWEHVTTGKHTFIQQDLTNNFLMGRATKPFYYNPSSPIQFDITLSNPYDVQMVMIHSTKGDETFTMVANWIPAEGVYRAEGYFNPSNTSYMMGELSIEAIKDDPIMYDTETEKFYGSSDAIDYFSESLKDVIMLETNFATDEITENSSVEEVYTSDELTISDIHYSDGENYGTFSHLEFKPDYFYHGKRKVTFEEAGENPYAYGFVRSSILSYDSETDTMYEQYERYATGDELKMLYEDYAISLGMSEEESKKYVENFDFANSTNFVRFRLAIHGETPETTEAKPAPPVSGLNAKPVKTELAKTGTASDENSKTGTAPNENELMLINEIDKRVVRINQTNEMIDYFAEKLGKINKKYETVSSNKAKKLPTDPDAGIIESFAQKYDTARNIEESKRSWDNFKKNIEINDKAFDELSSLEMEIANYQWNENGIPSDFLVTVEALMENFQKHTLGTVGKGLGYLSKYMENLYLALSFGTQNPMSDGYEDIADWTSAWHTNALKHSIKNARLKALEADNMRLEKEIADMYKRLTPEWQERLGYAIGSPVTAKVVYDPSGYVYEAVPENIISGATMTIYYRDPETGKEIQWDAEEYDQINPLLTDEAGSYAWDVPEGLWCVKCNLDGYEPMQSEWMTVPPIRTGVNFSVVNKTAPVLSSAVCADRKIILTFDKFMDNQTVTPENVKILSGETEISVKITPSTGDANYADTYVIEAENGKFPSGTLKVSVSENCKSYSGTAIKAVDSEIERPEEIISLKVNAAQVVCVDTETEFVLEAFPASVAKGKKIIFETDSAQIAMPESVVFDENGKATISLKANRTGTITLTFGIEDSDMTEDFQIAVIEPEIYEIYEENQPEETIIYGDVNGDNDVTMEDVVLIRRYIAGGWNVQIDERCADVNHDGRINLKDVVLIRRYIVGGWDVTF